MKIETQSLQSIYNELKPVAHAVKFNGNYTDEGRTLYESAGIDPFLTPEDFFAYNSNSQNPPLNIKIGGIHVGDSNTLIAIYNQALQFDAQDDNFDGKIAQAPEALLDITVDELEPQTDWQSIFAAASPSIFPIVVTTQKSSGEGTVWIVEAESLPGNKTRYYGITNSHVVDDDHQNEIGYSIRVPSPSGNGDESIDVSLLGNDGVFDVAVVTFEAEDGRFTPLPIDESESGQVAAGEELLIAGNRDGLDVDYLLGHVSQEFETNPTFSVFGFETDHDVAGGNSGSPVINSNGDVIGIQNSSVTDDKHSTAHNISISEVMRSYREIRSQGYATHGDLGISYTILSNDELNAITPDLDYPNGAWQVSQIIGNRENLAKELQPGDIVLEVDGAMRQDWENTALLDTAAYHKRPGESVDLKILRNNQTLTINIQLGSYCDRQRTTWEAPDGSVHYEIGKVPNEQFYLFSNTTGLFMSNLATKDDVSPYYSSICKLLSVNGKTFDTMQSLQKFLLNSPDAPRFVYTVTDSNGVVTNFTRTNPLFENVKK